MKTINYLMILCFSVSILFFASSCNKDANSLKTKVRTHTFTVNWFRDSTTSNPAAFIDFYNGKAYTMSEAAAHPDSIDIFVFDNSGLTVSANALSLINMVFFGNGTYAVRDYFNAVVGIQPMSRYNASLVSDVSINNVDYSNLVYNEDIANLFSSKSLNGGYTDIGIEASSLGDAQKYYQFYCARVNKRGIFRIISNNYLPGGTMTIEVKVEQ